MSPGRNLTPNKGGRIMRHALLLLTATLIMALATTGTIATAGGVPARAATVALSEPEAADLAFQREEEKLALEVYQTMYAKWQAAIFSNISDSEQRHTDIMKKMLDKHNLPDPALSVFGAFTDNGLQEKFDTLVEAGSRSLIGGLYVGATIEEIDMIDLQDAIDGTNHIDLLTAYQNLLEGSKNHLRSYVKDLEAQGVTYAPQYISKEFYDAIIEL